MDDKDDIPEATAEEQGFIMAQLAVRVSEYGARILELEAENAALRAALESKS